MRKYLVLLLAITFQPFSHAESFYEFSKRGWFWFEQRLEDESKKAPAHTLEHSSKSDPLDSLKSFQQELEWRKAAMIMQPSLENTRQYIKMQNEMFVKASIVSQNWQKALILYPELNIVKNTPISEAGLEITRNLEDKRNAQELKDFAKEFSLLFFYKSDCPYCERFADVVEYFSRKYGYSVTPITLNGKRLKIGGVYDADLIRRLNVQSVPSLFAFSNRRGFIVPIAHGFLPVDLLMRNVLTAKKIVKSNA